MRENIARGVLEKTRAERENSSLNMASRLNMAMRGERGRTREEENREEQERRLREKEENRENAWPNCQGYIGKRSWGKRSVAPRLERLMVWVRREELRGTTGTQ